MSRSRDEEPEIEPGGADASPEDRERTRRNDWIKWLLGAVDHAKARLGYSTVTDLIDASPIHQSTYFRWADPGPKGAYPKPGTLNEFCDFLDVDPAVPWSVLGFGRPSPAPIRAMSEQEIRAELRDADRILKNEHVRSDEVDVYLSLIRALTAELRLKIEQREREQQEQQEGTGGQGAASA
ncbi:hypothetical protein [Glycomyces tarimensis]